LPADVAGSGRLAPLRGADFAVILKSPSRRRGKHFSVHWRPSSSASRLGLVVSRKLSGSAVRRNLVKRQARALFADACKARQVQEMAGVDVVVRLIANVRALDRGTGFTEMRELFAGIARAGAGVKA
jgi:ribonuclease P protein component